MEPNVIEYRKKLSAFRDARNRIRAEAAALQHKVREHNRAVSKAFAPGEIDSHVRGSLMCDPVGQV